MGAQPDEQKVLVNAGDVIDGAHLHLIRPEHGMLVDWFKSINVFDWCISLTLQTRFPSPPVLVSHFLSLVVPS